LKKKVAAEEEEARIKKEEAEKEAARLRQEAIDRGENPEGQEGCHVQ
jgi:hypothetical protein